MTHESDCPAAYPCCPNDEYGCPIHAQPPCNCEASSPVMPSSRKVGGGHDE